MIMSVVLIATGIIIFYNIKQKNKGRLSFKESFDLTGLPIITLYSDNTKLNFILDTGSTNSHINKEVFTALNAEKCPYTSTVFGMEGNKIECEYYKVPIKYKEISFVEEFCSTDLSNAFKSVKEESGVQLHGILGSDFFERRKYILNFSNLTAYIR